MPTKPVSFAEWYFCRLICRMGQIYGWNEDPTIYLNYCSFDGQRSPELQQLVVDAIEFRATYPISVHPNAPALKVQDKMLTYLYPAPPWERLIEIEITDDVQDAWLSGQEVYSEWLYPLSGQRRVNL